MSRRVGVLPPVRPLGSTNGSRSLMVKHVVHRKTLIPRGHLTVASHVMHFPVTGSCLGAEPLGCITWSFATLESFSSSVLWSLLPWRAFLSCRREPKKEGNG